MSIADEIAIMKGQAERGVESVTSANREGVIRHVWSLIGDKFNYETGHLTMYHDLGIVRPIRYEMNRYGNVVVIEAEGIIVKRVPVINFRKV